MMMTCCVHVPLRSCKVFICTTRLLHLSVSATTALDYMVALYILIQPTYDDTKMYINSLAHLTIVMQLIRLVG
ncbi:uncharacterized protein SCHCODRAFT_02302696 [Schizophyllum commune H4-8]|uniref:uncharacterized protein n=1 Tax=Schizophyllum commune (strain H4-8 / FGSC 9210) TaxID=578458 RepID=UPI002160C4DC|nr:uncharacterized protein SCHCODRAFT_02302696 [Schizophyllum commune H4-8]KAI5892839.1 hypothetical protein SCHCODRAFT_02302696 [Schizophyllum commune H4-8]